MFLLAGSLLSVMLIVTALVVSFADKNGILRYILTAGLLSAAFLLNDIEDKFILGPDNLEPIFVVYSIFSLQLISATVAFYLYKLLRPEGNTYMASLLTLLPIVVTGLGISAFLSEKVAFTRVYSLADFGELLPGTKIGLLYLSIILATVANLMLMAYLCFAKKTYYQKYIYERYDNIYSLQTYWISPLLFLFIITITLSLLSSLTSSLYFSYLLLGLWMISLLFLAWYVTNQRSPMLEFSWSKKSKRKIDEEEFKEVVIRGRYHIKTGITINSLAKELSVNASTLSKYFTSIGSDFFTYINTIRVEHAIELLSANDRNDLTQSDIADICGFTSKRNMELTFKLLTNTLPYQYKNQRKNK